MGVVVFTIIADEKLPDTTQVQVVFKSRVQVMQ